MRKYVAFAAITCIVVAALNLSSCKGKKSEPQANNKQDSVQKMVERGKYLVTNVTPCLDCHSKRDFSKFSGPITPGTEGMGGEEFDQKNIGVPGTIYAKNITPDIETGIGTWTDDEIMRAMTQGINKKGDTLFPLMPYVNFSHMAKEDLLSIIAYIRTLKPIKNQVPARQLMIPISMAYPGRAIAANTDNNKRPPETDLVNYGAYLINACACSDCHTPMVKGQPDFSKLFAGGYHFDIGIFNVNSANITPDSATGIGAWNEDRFLTKFTQYRDEKNYNFDPGKQNTYMPLTSYAGMTDGDLKAIYAFLRTVKPVKNLVEKYPK